MNYLYYIIGTILVIFIIYFIYLWVTRNTQIIYLNTKNPSVTINESQIEDPESISFTFSLWVCIKHITDELNILTYGNNKLHLKDKTKLCYDISSNSVKEVEITTNFPQEQWVYVNISVIGNVYSFYLDGKLVKTIQYENTSFPDTKQIVLGDSKQNKEVHIANFNRKPISLTHYDIAREYEKQKYMKDYYKSAKYNLEISLTNGDINEKSYALFTK